MGGLRQAAVRWTRGRAGLDPKIAEHHGRIVMLMGEGMLAEFLISNSTVLLRAIICFESGAKCEEASPSIGKSQLSHKLDSVTLV